MKNILGFESGSSVCVGMEGWVGGDTGFGWDEVKLVRGLKR